MPLPIKVNSTDVVITPFFDMQHKEMLHSYRKGIRAQIESERGLRPILDLVLFLKLASRTNLFERREPADIYRSVGYEFGSIHGGILTSERTLRSDVTALVAFDDNQDAIREYKAGRQWFFEEAGSDERTMTDGQLIERLRELTKDAAEWHDPEGVWFFTVGCLLGELSGHLFPLTDQERQQWQAQAEAIMKEYGDAHQTDQESQTQDTEPLTLVPTPTIEFAG
jgi:hypothetical protein